MPESAGRGVSINQLKGKAPSTRVEGPEREPPLDARRGPRVASIRACRCDTCGPWEDSCPGGEWVRANTHYDDEKNLGTAKSPEDCVKKALKKCDNPDIARTRVTRLLDERRSCAGKSNATCCRR